METITLVSYDERVNKNGKTYLVVKGTNDISYMCNDPRIFDTIKSSAIISAEVAVEVTANATFHKIVSAITVQPGELAKSEPKPKWTGGGSSGGGGGGFKADPAKQAFIIRQSSMDHALEVAMALLKDGHLELKEGETVAQAVMRYGFGIAEKIEAWVRAAEPTADRTPVAAPVPLQAVPTLPAAQAAAPAAPAAPQEAVGGEFDNLPF